MRLELLNLLQDRFLNFIMPGTRCQWRKDDVQGRITVKACISFDLGGQIPVGNSFVQTTVLSVGQNRAEQRERSIVGVRCSRNLVRKGKHAELSRTLDCDASLAGLGGFLCIHRRNRFGRAWVDAEGFLDQGQRLGHLKVANDGNRGIVGPVVSVVKLSQLFDRNLFYVAAVPNGAVMIGVGNKCGLVNFLVQGLHG